MITAPAINPYSAHKFGTIVRVRWCNIVYDISCKDDKNELFIIEIQRTRQEHFEDRAVFYACRCISDQAPNEKGSGWEYNLKNVYMILRAPY